MRVECATYTCSMRVQIPDNLRDRIEDVADENGYNSIADLARESIRLRLDQLENKEAKLDDK